jgi:dTDP-4-dehydrorhamnose reductase
LKIFLLGKNGQVGWELQRTLAPLGEVIAPSRLDLDLTDQHAIRRAVRTSKPSLIVNAAAYTAVDKAEEEPELAMAVNGIAPGILAEEAALNKALFVHYSTDYIFDGTKGSPYNEEDLPNPLNVYGKTKLAGEKAIRKTEAAHLILRTSWVYGLRGNNFLLTILRLANENNELRIVNDQFGSPTWSRMIAETTAFIISNGLRDIFAYAKKNFGIYNLSASGQTTWCQFAEKVLQLTTDNKRTLKNITPVSTSDYLTPAKRPLFSVLDNKKLLIQFGFKLPDWDSSLELVLSENIKNIS